MPVWFVRLCWGLCLGVGVVYLVIALVKRDIEFARDVPFLWAFAALLILVDRNERGKDPGVRKRRTLVGAVGAGLGAVVMALITPWTFDTPWTPIGLFLTLFLGILSVALVLAYSHRRPT